MDGKTLEMLNTQLAASLSEDVLKLLYEMPKKKRPQ